MHFYRAWLSRLIQIDSEYKKKNMSMRIGHGRTYRAYLEMWIQETALNEMR